MKARNVLFGAVLVIATAAVTSQVVSQNTTKEKTTKAPPQAAPEMTPEMQEMMTKCMEAGTPGENHKLLSNKVGRWHGTGKMWWTPDSPPADTTCTAEVTSLWEGRYFTETVEGTMPGEAQTFLGKACYGYDNVSKKFFWAWIDNMSTGMMNAEGTYNPTAKTFTFTSEWNCPLTGKQVRGRSTEKWIDNDHFVMEMYGPWYKTGKDYKMMEFTYTRAK
jgi:hypothetical protein